MPSQEQEEMRRFQEALKRAFSASPGPKAMVYVRSQGERIKEPDERLREEQAEQRRLEKLKEDAERQPHGERQVIWFEPWCSICDRDNDREERSWSRENNWKDGCERCGYPPVKYVLAADQT